MPRIGNSIGGKYVLQELIGEGSMGSVWRAVHETLGRPFAVKFLKSYGSPGDQLEARFLQEARLAAAIQHRFVVSIVDFGMTDEATPYMVMDFLQGESLAVRVAHAPGLPARELVRIMAQSLVGLEAVHRAGVVHRDLKPENIMLVSEAGGQIPKLVDFGISRAEHGADGHAPSPLTAPGIAMGTPWYMSPEQVRGEPIDRRTDLYSMGVLLYQTLAGRFPYDAPTVNELLGRILGGGAAPLSLVRPELGAGLSGIVERAMADSPASRFATASEMASALFAVMNQVPEELTCPVRVSDSKTSPHRVVPRPFIPSDAEVSADMLAPTSSTSQGHAVPASSTWLTRPTFWWSAGSIALALSIALVATSMVGSPPERRPRTAPAAMLPAPPEQPAVTPLDTAVEPAPVPPRSPEAVATEAAAPVIPERRAAVTRSGSAKRARPGRKPARPPPREEAQRPPDAFTSPGF